MEAVEKADVDVALEHAGGALGGGLVGAAGGSGAGGGKKRAGSIEAAAAAAGGAGVHAGGLFLAPMGHAVVAGAPEVHGDAAVFKFLPGLLVRRYTSGGGAAPS